ncbi:hypothetical protein ACIPPS_05305 [Streptomyces sp. NPDC090127]|uniref:hypothetical protein n=1 Tax=Streptomyces sp. NPDC090127 TaxID=3365953 RepID=UPI00381B75FC
MDTPKDTRTHARTVAHPRPQSGTGTHTGTTPHTGSGAEASRTEASRTKASHTELSRTADGVRAQGALRDAALWIEALLRQFPELLTELAPGRRSAGAGPASAPRSPAPELLREERRDALLVQQRHGLTVPGRSSAPIRLHISDAIRDITDGVVELDEAVHDKLGLGRPRHARVPERLARIVGLLGEVSVYPALAEHVRDESRRMARRCARALGDAESMVRVRGRCPWCDSVSLRAFPARRAVLCVNPSCRCADTACDCRTDPAYRHVWHDRDWDALASAAGADRGEIAASMDTTDEGVRR